MRIPIEKGFLHTSLVDVAKELDNVDERLNTLDEEARPGNRMVDLYEGRTMFTGVNVLPDKWPLHLRKLPTVTPQGFSKQRLCIPRNAD